MTLVVAASVPYSVSFTVDNCRHHLVGINPSQLHVHGVGHRIGAGVDRDAAALLPAVNLRGQRIELNNAVIQIDVGMNVAQHAVFVSDGSDCDGAATRGSRQEARLRSRRGVSRR